MEEIHEQSHAPDHETAHHVNKHVKGYILVGGVLLFCTFLTVAMSYVNLGRWNMVVGMALATFKAGCVAAIFMHLKSEKWTIYRFLLITVVFAIGLFLLTALAFHDPIRLN